MFFPRGPGKRSGRNLIRRRSIYKGTSFAPESIATLHPRFHRISCFSFISLIMLIKNMVTIESNVNELGMNRMIKCVTFRKARKWQTHLIRIARCFANSIEHVFMHCKGICKVFSVFRRKKPGKLLSKNLIRRTSIYNGTLFTAESKITFHSRFYRIFCFYCCLVGKSYGKSFDVYWKGIKKELRYFC